MERETTFYLNQGSTRPERRSGVDAKALGAAFELFPNVMDCGQAE
jgi:hypothetical protein